MKPEKLAPAEKRHVVNLPWDIDVNDVDIESSTPVFVMVGYRPTRASASRPRYQDLTGATSRRPFIDGTWGEIARRYVAKITPTAAGYYTVVVSAFVNVAPPDEPPRYERTVFRTIEIKVVRRRP